MLILITKTKKQTHTPPPGHVGQSPLRHPGQVGWRDPSTLAFSGPGPGPSVSQWTEPTIGRRGQGTRLKQGRGLLHEPRRKRGQSLGGSPGRDSAYSARPLSHSSGGSSPAPVRFSELPLRSQRRNRPFRTRHCFAATFVWSLGEAGPWGESWDLSGGLAALASVILPHPCILTSGLAPHAAPSRLAARLDKRRPVVASLLCDGDASLPPAFPPKVTSFLSPRRAASQLLPTGPVDATRPPFPSARVVWCAGRWGHSSKQGRRGTCPLGTDT